MRSFKQKVKELKNKVTNSNSYYKIITKKNQLLDWVEIHPWKTLIILYFLFVGIKITILPINQNIAPLDDQYYYMKMGQSFLNNLDFYIDGEPSHLYPPLYSIFISPAYFFEDMNIVFMSIGIINVFLVSLLIFPSFLISREFFRIKFSIIFAILVSIFPWNINMMFDIRAENLYFPLFLFTFFLLYKALIENGYKYKVTSGFFIGLCFLTRYTTISLILAMLIVFISFSLIKNESSKLKSFFKGIKNWFIVNIIAGFTILIWFIRNGMHFGYNFTGLIGYTGEIKHTLTRIGGVTASSDLAKGNNGSLDFIYNFLIQITTHNGFIIWSSGIIFFSLVIIMLYNAYQKKEYKIFLLAFAIFITTEFYIILTAWHNGSQIWTLRCHRYYEPLLPLLIFIGYLSLTKLKNNFRLLLYSLFICFIPLIFLLNIIEIPIFIQHIEKIVGFSPPASSIIVLGLLIWSFIIYCFIVFSRKRIYKKHIVLLAGLLIISAGSLGSFRDVYQRDVLSRSDAVAIGKDLNSQFSGENFTIYFDNDQMIHEIRLIVGGWINAPIRVVNISNIKSNNGYIISTRILNLTLLYSANFSYSRGDLQYKCEYDDVLYVYEFRR